MNQNSDLFGDFLSLYYFALYTATGVFRFPETLLSMDTVRMCIA